MAGYFRDRKILEPSCYSFRSPDGKEEMIYVLENNFGFPLTKEEFYKEKEFLIDFLKKAEESYNNPNIEIYLQILKTEANLYYTGFKKNENGKFVIPEPKEYNIKCKKFNPNKQKWSFKCGWCGKKVSADIQDYYYVIFLDYISHFGTPDDKRWERGCSKECAAYIWYDLHKDWIYEKGLKDYFEF